MGVPLEMRQLMQNNHLLSRLYLALGLAIPQMACGHDATGPRTRPSVTHITAATDIDGLAHFPSQDLQVAIRNTETQELVEGINVTLLRDGVHYGILIVDPLERYPIKATLLNSLQTVPFAATRGFQPHGGALTTYEVDLALRSAFSSGTVALSDLTANMVLYIYDTFYDCEIATLADAYGQVAEHALSEVPGSLTLFSFVGLYDPTGTVALIGLFKEARDVILSFWNVAYLDHYEAQGYSATQQFEVCTPKLGFAELVGNSLSVLPLEPPGTRPQQTASLVGFVRDVTTSLPLANATVELSGPNVGRALTSADGAYAFTPLVAGTYMVSTRAAGYAIAQFGPFAISPNSAQQHDIFLEPLSFFDDFERPDATAVGNGWLEYEPGGSTEVTGGALHITTGSQTGDGAKVFRPLPIHKNLKISGTVRFTRAFSRLWVLVRADGSTSLRNGYGFSWRFTGPFDNGLNLLDNATDDLDLGGFQSVDVQQGLSLGQLIAFEMLISTDNSLQVRVWAQGTTRPVSPTIASGPRTPIASGTNVAIVESTRDLTLGDVYVDDLSISPLVTIAP
jgi:Carboxypeptidase regulatory-like domain